MPPPNRKLEVLAALPLEEITKNTRRGKTGTVAGLVEVIGVNAPHVRRYLRTLYAEGLAHIGCWNRTSGRYAPVWIQGAGQHALEPKPLKGAAYSRRHRARVKRAVERAKVGFKYDERYKGKVALAKAAEVAQKTRIAPQHWFSPLGL